MIVKKSLMVKLYKKNDEIKRKKNERMEKKGLTWKEKNKEMRR